MARTLGLALLLAASPSWCANLRANAPLKASVILTRAALAPLYSDLPNVVLPQASALTPQIAPGAPASAGAAQEALAAPNLEALSEVAGVGPAAGNDTESAGAVPAEARSDTAFDGSRRLRVVMGASETVPFVKTGGLADVVDGVSRGLAARGHLVTVFLPKYSTLNLGSVAFERLPLALPIRVGHRDVPATFLTGRHENVQIVLVENDPYYARDRPYGFLNSSGDVVDYGDNDERFIFFSKAVIAASHALRLAPDVFHVHDWQAALIPAMLKLLPRPESLQSSRSALSLHNLAFQGNFPYESVWKAGFWHGDFTYEKLEFYGRLGFLKAGIAMADALTTVSRTYAKQIQENGMGLEGLLRYRSRDLHGIVNGIDPRLWNPLTDPALPHRYGLSDAEPGKAINRASLQNELDLPIDSALFLFGVASRLSDQKGIDMIADAIPELAALGVQIAITGNGDRAILHRLRSLEKSHPETLGLNPSFSEDMARRIIAASHAFLMPSRFEPCGISQMLAQRYGSVPIVAPTGGLLETVKDAEIHADGDGFFMREISTRGLIEAVKLVLERRRDPAGWSRLRANGMNRDNSWDPSVREYESLFRRLIGA